MITVVTAADLLVMCLCCHSPFLSSSVSLSSLIIIFIIAVIFVTLCLDGHMHAVVLCFFFLDLFLYCLNFLGQLERLSLSDSVRIWKLLSS